jgi:hypothetical protein
MLSSNLSVYIREDVYNNIIVIHADYNFLFVSFNSYKVNLFITVYIFM